MSASTLWNWVQAKGKQAEAELNAQLQQQTAGSACQVEVLDETLSALPLESVCKSLFTKPETFIQHRL